LRTRYLAGAQGPAEPQRLNFEPGSLDAEVKFDRFGALNAAQAQAGKEPMRFLQCFT
jgi:hypothetical protein